jgi:hypothetical protein
MRRRPTQCARDVYAYADEDPMLALARGTVLASARGTAATTTLAQGAAAL